MTDGETTPCCRLIMERREKPKLYMCPRGAGVLGKLREAQRTMVFCLIPREASGAGPERHPGARSLRGECSWGSVCSVASEGWGALEEVLLECKQREARSWVTHSRGCSCEFCQGVSSGQVDKRHLTWGQRNHGALRTSVLQSPRAVWALFPLFNPIPSGGSSQIQERVIIPD